MIQVPKLTIEGAHLALEGLKKAKELDVPTDIAVIEESGNLLAFERMKGALVRCMQIAIEKAYTSAVLGIPTAEEDRMAQPGESEYGANTPCGERIAIVGR